MPFNHKEEGMVSLQNMIEDVGPVVDAIDEAEKASQGSVQQLSALERAKTLQVLK